MKQNIFKGLGIALVTPFASDGSVDYDVLKNLLDYQLKNGADFFCILATTGETPTLTKDEKQKIKELVVEKVGDKVPILIGCGGNNTADVVNELQTADFSGIDGILSVCPYYNKPSQEGLYQHFKAIAGQQICLLCFIMYPDGRELTLRLRQQCALHVTARTL